MHEKSQFNWNFLKGRKWTASLVIIGFIILIAWIFTIPFDHAPDEKAHYGLMYYIAQYHRLPVAGNQIIYHLIGDYTYYYGALPSLPYIFGAVGIIIGKHIGDINSLYIYARFMATLFGITTLYLTIKTVRLLFNNNYFMQIGVPIVVLLTPQASFLFSYANNDAFTTFAMSLCYYFMVKCTVENWSNKNAVLLGTAVGIALLSKLNSYIIIPLIGIFFAISFKNEFKRGLKFLVLTALPVIIVSGWWFVRNIVIYKGDILALKTSKLTNIVGFQAKGWSVFKFLTHTGWIESSFNSSWGVFDYLSIFMPLWYYRTVLGIVVLSILGITLYLYKKIRSDKLDNKAIIIGVIFSVAIIFSILLSLWTSYTNDYQAQGKYLYTAFLPFSIFLVFGINNLAETFLKKKKILAIIVFVSFFVYMNIYSMFLLNKVYNFVYESNGINLLSKDIEVFNNIEITKKDGKIYYLTTGSDPQSLIKNVNITTNSKQIMILQSDTDTDVQIYWDSNVSPGFNEDKSIKLKCRKGIDYIIRIGQNNNWKGVINIIRIDPSNESHKEVIIEKFELY